MKKVIGLIAVVLTLAVLGVKASSSADVSETVLSSCCHTLKEDPDSNGSGSWRF